MNAATTTSAGASAAGQQQGQPAPQALVPFIRGSLEHVENMLDVTTALSAASVPVSGGLIDVPSYGYMRSLVILCEATGGTGSAAVYKEDSPWAAMQDVTLSDVNGTTIVTLTGYSLYLANRYGGYSFSGVATQNFVYVTPTTAGNFSFIIRVPVEIARRDALGALPNMNAQSTYKLRITQAANTDIYSTQPTGAPTLRWRIWLEAWAQPGQGTAGQLNAQQPAAVGTVQYWSQTVLNVAGAGQQRLRLPRTGNLVRNLILVWRNATPARTFATMPTDLTFEWDSHNVFTAGLPLLQLYAGERTGYNASIDTGVIPISFCHDFDGKSGDELRDLWLATTQATRLELSGNFGAAGTLTVITNDVAPAANVFLAA